ncbi:uncharacterized protein At4g15970-like [Tasmannia lanceolata]|uniref:uncharacterized protein At4g15970-like n=1 Tax=Tasmannia lanceolata TaxID=3420 RepID=UPI0040640EB4
MMQSLKRFPLASIPFLLLFLFLFFILSAISTQMRGTPWHLWTKPGPGSLEYVLNKASMADRTVIITTLNEAWAAPNSMVDLFLESFRIGEQTASLLNHLVIVAMDQKAFDRCKLIHTNCFSVTTEGVDFSAEKRFMSQDYLKMMWRRIQFLRLVLKLGYNFVFTDADVMWIRNPFPHFMTTVDITMACDGFMGDISDRKNRVNGGFNYVRSNNATIKFYKYWYNARKVHPHSHDQAVFDIIKFDSAVKGMGLEMRFLDTAYFSGFCQSRKDFDKVCTFHANCCVGLESKLNDLRLVLEDWRNFSALSTEEKRVKRYSWRAPRQCHF